MPMPALDPLRYVPVMPVDPSHKVPREDGLRTFSRDPANPDLLDLFNPYEAQLLAGGSVRRACEVETADAQTAAQAAAEKAAAEEAERAAAAASEAKAVDKPAKDAEPSTPKADGAPPAA